MTIKTGQCVEKFARVPADRAVEYATFEVLEDELDAHRMDSFRPPFPIVESVMRMSSRSCGRAFRRIYRMFGA